MLYKYMCSTNPRVFAIAKHNDGRGLPECGEFEGTRWVLWSKMHDEKALIECAMCGSTREIFASDLNRQGYHLFKQPRMLRAA